MKDILFVDGYNIIHSWSLLKEIVSNVNLEAAREKLADMIGEYAAFSGIDAIVVFDAYMVKGASSKEVELPGVKVVYTSQYQTADSYIERCVAQLDRYQQNIYVATSDAMEQIVVSSQGAARISARELLNQLNKKGAERNKISKQSPSSDLGSMLDDEIIEKMRRLSEVK